MGPGGQCCVARAQRRRVLLRGEGANTRVPFVGSSTGTTTRVPFFDLVFGSDVTPSSPRAPPRATRSTRRRAAEGGGRFPRGEPVAFIAAPFFAPDVCRGSGAASATRLLDRVSDPFKDVDGERGAFEPRRDDRDGRQPRRARFVKIARRDLLCFVEERVERVQVSRVAVQYPTTCPFTARVGGWGLINVIIPFRERNRTHTSAKKKTRNN